MGDMPDGSDIFSTTSKSSATSVASSVSPLTAIDYAKQAEKLSLVSTDEETDGSGTAVAVDYVTPQDPIIITANGGRLPGVPLAEADKLNVLRAEMDGEPLKSTKEIFISGASDPANSDGETPRNSSTIQRSGEGTLRRSMPPSRTNPLFPPLPLYGPSSTLRKLQCIVFRVTSSILSLVFLGIIVLGAVFTSIPLAFKYLWLRLTLRDPDARRPFIEEERRRQRIRNEQNAAWTEKKFQTAKTVAREIPRANGDNEFIPTEGGPDPLICNLPYYARRVGLDMEEFRVQTEDGFIISLWHVYNPYEYAPLPASQRAAHGPEVFDVCASSSPISPNPNQNPKFPILLIHGLCQSAGAYCTNDDDSLAFYLCKAGYDVWLGNNRCGFHPEHTLLSYSDPRMWAWNIRQMGVMDLPALTSRVLLQTGFPKLALVAHSQGTTQTFVALAKEQRPDLGSKISVFCALAPAAYAGPLIGKAYFKFMRVISPAMFRLIFGIHAFIPFMMTMHTALPGWLYGALGYRVFSFLFNWSDERWDRGLRDRLFQFSPVYVSAESMRWWLGRECFAKHKCILQTRETGSKEDAEDAEDERADLESDYQHDPKSNVGFPENHAPKPAPAVRNEKQQNIKPRQPKGSTAWYNDKVPPFALWVAGSDDLVDGRRLLRRFKRGREPHVRVIHEKVISEYEHLDVLWAMDSIEKVGREVKEVVWKTVSETTRAECRVPKDCEGLDVWKDPKEERGGRYGGLGGNNDDDDDRQSSSSSSDEDEEGRGANNIRRR